MKYSNYCVFMTKTPLNSKKNKVKAVHILVINYYIYLIFEKAIITYQNKIHIDHNLVFM